MARFVEVISTTSGGAERRVKMPFDQFVTEVSQDSNFPESGSVSLETPTGEVDGANDEFVFTAPPILVFRNGVNETRLGSISTNTFTFDSPPSEGDDIEGIV